MRKSQWSIVNSQWSVRGIAKCILLLFTFHFSLLTLNAQSVSASLDRDKILLGEQVTLQFNLGNVSNLTSLVAGWPQLADTLSHTEVLKKSAIDTITVNDVNTYTQSFTLTSFDSGQWQLGPFLFVIQDKVTGKQIQLTTQPVFLTVLPVDVSSMKDYHPIKDIIGVETSFNWMPVIIAAIVIVLVIVVFIIIKNRKKRIAEKPKIVLKGTPLERALEKLQALQNEKLTSNIAIKKFHSETDIVTRQYFEEMLNIKALQLTISEIFARMNVYLQDAQLRRKFQQVFELNTAVKFAKYMPQEEESKATLNEIINSLQRIDESVNIARNNADRMVSKY